MFVSATPRAASLAATNQRQFLAPEVEHDETSNQENDRHPHHTGGVAGEAGFFGARGPLRPFLVCRNRLSGTKAGLLDSDPQKRFPTRLS